MRGEPPKVEGKQQTWWETPCVAEIRIAPDGRGMCALMWLGEHCSIAVYSSLTELYEVHVKGHKPHTYIVTPDRDWSLESHPMHLDEMIDAVEAEGRVTNLKRTGKPAPFVWCRLDAWANIIGIGDLLEHGIPANADSVA